MKYLPLALILAFSCAVIPNYNLPTCTSPEDAGAWIVENINYVLDDYTASPEQTVLTGEGDCRDKAILCLAMVKQNLGVEGKIVLYDTPYGQHATAKFPGYEFGYIEGSTQLGRPIHYYWAMTRLVGHSGTIYN